VIIDMQDVRPGTSVQVVAGIRHDWLERLASFSDFPRLPEIEVKVTATILRVHRTGNIEFTKTFSPAAGKLLAIRIDHSMPQGKEVTFIPADDPRYELCMSSKTTFGGFIRR
jgi:hypothetical protein